MLRGEPRRLQISGGGGVELNVVESGRAAGRPILFVHGYCQSSAVWCRQFESELADAFRLVAFDLRGHGASAMPSEPQAYRDSQQWADDLAAVIDRLELARPTIVAWSYGGLVLCDYLRFHSSQALAAIDFVAAPTSQGGEKGRAFNGPQFAALFPALFATDEPTLAPALERLTALCKVPRAAPTSQVAREAMVRGRKSDNDDLLAALRIPVLCTHGDADAVVTLAAGEHIASVVPHAQLSIYPGVGHAPFYEDAQRFNRELAALAGR